MAIKFKDKNNTNIFTNDLVLEQYKQEMRKSVDEAIIKVEDLIKEKRDFVNTIPDLSKMSDREKKILDKLNNKIDRYEKVKAHKIMAAGINLQENASRTLYNANSTTYVPSSRKKYSSSSSSKHDDIKLRNVIDTLNDKGFFKLESNKAVNPINTFMSYTDYGGVNINASVSDMEFMRNKLNKMISNKQGFIHSIDTETLGATSSSNVWRPSFVTEFAKVTTDLSNPSKTIKTNVLLTGDSIYDTEYKRIMDALNGGKAGQRLIENDNSLRVSLERFALYGHSKTTIGFDPIKGYSQVNSIASIDDITNIYDKDLIEAGYRKLKRAGSRVQTKTVNVGGKDLKIRADLKEYIDSLYDIQNSLAKGKGIVNGYNIIKFDNKTINSSLQYMLSQKGNKDALDYAKDLFGVSNIGQIGIHLNERNTIDMQDLTRAYTHYYGNKSLLGTDIFNKIHGLQVNKQEYLGERFYPELMKKASHAALADTEVVHAMLLSGSSTLNGQSLFEHLFQGVTDNKIHKSSVIDKTTVLMANKGTMFNNDRNVLDFVTDASNNIYFSSGHSIIDGKLRHDKINVSPFNGIRKNNLYMLNDTFSIDASKFYDKIGIDLPDYSNGKMYVAKFNILPGEYQLDGISNEGSVYKTFSTQNEMLGFLNSNFSVLGYYDDDFKDFSLNPDNEDLIKVAWRNRKGAYGVNKEWKNMTDIEKIQNYASYMEDQYIYNKASNFLYGNSSAKKISGALDFIKEMETNGYGELIKDNDSLARLYLSKGKNKQFGFGEKDFKKIEQIMKNNIGFFQKSSQQQVVLPSTAINSIHALSGVVQLQDYYENVLTTMAKTKSNIKVSDKTKYREIYNQLAENGVKVDDIFKELNEITLGNIVLEQTHGNTKKALEEVSHVTKDARTMYELNSMYDFKLGKNFYLGQKNNKIQKFSIFNSVDDYITLDVNKSNPTSMFLNDLTRKFTKDVQVRNPETQYRYQRAAFSNFIKEINNDRRAHKELFKNQDFVNMVEDVLENQDFDLEDSAEQLIDTVKKIKRGGKNAKVGITKPRYSRAIHVRGSSAKVMNEMSEDDISKILRNIKVVSLTDKNKSSLVNEIVASRMFDKSKLTNNSFQYKEDQDRAFRLYEDFQRRMTSTVEDLMEALDKSGTSVTFDRMTGGLTMTRNGESKVITELPTLKMDGTNMYLQTYGGTNVEYHEAVYFDKKTGKIRLGTNLGDEFGEKNRILKRVNVALDNDNPNILDVINQRMIRNASEYKESALMNFSIKDYLTGNSKIDFSQADGVFSYIFGKDATPEGEAIWSKLVSSGKLNSTNIQNYVETLSQLNPKELSPILRTMSVTDVATIMQEFVDKNDPNAPAISEILKTVAMTNKDTDVARGIYTTNSRVIGNTMNLFDNQGRPTVVSQLNSKYLRSNTVECTKHVYENLLIGSSVIEDTDIVQNIYRNLNVGLDKAIGIQTDFTHSAAHLGTIGLNNVFAMERERVLKNYNFSNGLSIDSNRLPDIYDMIYNTYVGSTFEQSRLVDSRMIDAVYGTMPQDIQKLSSLKDLDNALKTMESDVRTGKANNKVREAIQNLGTMTIDDSGNVNYKKSYGSIVHRGEGIFKTSSSYGDQILPFGSKFDNGVLNFHLRTKEDVELTEKEISELLSKKVKQELQGKSAAEAEELIKGYRRPEGLFKLLLSDIGKDVKGTFEVHNVNASELIKMGNSDKGMSYIPLAKTGSLDWRVERILRGTQAEKLIGNHALTQEALSAYLYDFYKDYSVAALRFKAGDDNINSLDEFINLVLDKAKTEQHELSRMIFSEKGIFKGNVSAVINDNYIGHKNFGATNSGTLSKATELLGKYYGSGSKEEQYMAGMDMIIDMINNNKEFQFLQEHINGKGQVAHTLRREGTSYIIDEPVKAEIDNYSSFNQESFNKLIDAINKKLIDANADIDDRMAYSMVYTYNKKGELERHLKVLGNLRTYEQKVNGEVVRIAYGVNENTNVKLYNDSEVQSYISKDFLNAQKELQEKRAEYDRLKQEGEGASDIAKSLKEEINTLQDRITSEEPYSKRIKIDDQYRNILSGYKLDSVAEDDFNKAVKEGRINQKFIDAAREYMIQDDKGNWKFKEDLKSNNVYHGFLENIKGLMTYDPTKEQKLTEDMLQDKRYSKYSDIFNLVTKDMNMDLGVESAERIHGLQGVWKSYNYNNAMSHTIEKDLLDNYGFKHVPISEFANSFGRVNEQLDGLVNQGYIVDLGKEFNNIKVAVPGMGSYAGNQEIRKDWHQQYNALTRAWEEYNNYVGDPKNTDDNYIMNLKGKILDQVNEIKEASNKAVSKQGELGLMGKIEVNLPYTRTKLLSTNDAMTVSSFTNPKSALPIPDNIDLPAYQNIKENSFKSKAKINGKTLAQWEKGGLKDGVFFDYGVAGVGEFERMGFFDPKVLQSMNMNRKQMENYLEENGTMELVNRYPNIIDRSVQNVRMFLDKSRPDNGVSLAEWTMLKMNGDSDGDSVSKMLVEHNGINYAQFNYSRDRAIRLNKSLTEEDLRYETVNEIMTLGDQINNKLTEDQAKEVYDQFRKYEASVTMEAQRNIDNVAEFVIPTMFKDEAKNFKISGGETNGIKPNKPIAVFVEGMTNVSAQVEGGKSILGKIRVTNLQEGPGRLDTNGGTSFLIENTNKINNMMQDIFANKENLIKSTGVNFNEYTHLNDLFNRVSAGEGSLNIHNFKYGEEQHKALDEMLSIFEKDKASKKPILSSSIAEAQDAIINRIRADIYNQTATSKSNKGVIGEVNAALYSIRQASSDVLGTKSGDNQASFVNQVLQKVGYELEEHVISSKKKVFEPGDTRLKNVSEFISNAKFPSGSSLESTKSDVSSWIYDYMDEGKINEIYQSTIGRSSGAPTGYGIEQVEARAKSYFQSAQGMLTQEQATAKAQADFIGDAFVTGIHNLNNDEEGHAAIQMYGVFGRRSGTFQRMADININDLSSESYNATAYRIVTGQKALEKIQIPEPKSVNYRNIEKPRIRDLKTASKEVQNLTKDVLGNVSSSGIAMGVLGLAAGLMISGYASGNPLKDPKNDNMENKPQEVKNTPLPTFFNEQGGYAQTNPQQQGYIINIKADSRRGQRYTKKAMKQAVEASVGGSVNINMNFKSNNSGGFSDKDIQDIISNYL